MKLALQITMSEEAKYICNELKLKKDKNFKSKFPHSTYRGEVHGHEIYLIVNGRYPNNDQVPYIGTEAAAMATHLIINETSPELLINAGTAGGRAEMGNKIGDVLVASKVYYHDHRISLEGYHDCFIGGYTPSSHVDKIDLPKVIMSSGNSFDLNDEDLALIKSFKSQAKDMELASIAWVADLYQIPWIALKSITDLIDTEHSSKEQFLEHFELACQNLATEVSKALIKL